MGCSKCGLDKKIVNKHFDLCLQCNNLRLYGNIYGKQYKGIQNKSNPQLSPKKPKKFPPKKKSKSKKSLFTSNLNIKEKQKHSMIELDEIFYEKCFNASNHKCEECGCNLPDQFRDEDGKIIARWRYSHIIPKSIAKHLRHLMNNINHLCLKCHMRWENGDRENMKIYPENAKKFPKYF